MGFEGINRWPAEVGRAVTRLNARKVSGTNLSPSEIILGWKVRCAQPMLGDAELSTTEPSPNDGGPTGVATDGPAMADLYMSQMEQRREMQDEIQEIRGERDEE